MTFDYLKRFQTFQCMSCFISRFDFSLSPCPASPPQSKQVEQVFFSGDMHWVQWNLWVVILNHAKDDLTFS